MFYSDCVSEIREGPCVEIYFWFLVFQKLFSRRATGSESRGLQTCAIRNALCPRYQLVDADSGDPHNTEGANFFMYSYKHYDYVAEPTDPRKPDLAQGRAPRFGGLQ